MTSEKSTDQKYRMLVALDLDGTSVRYEPRLEMDPGLMECLRHLKKQGVRWVMNSDRYTETMVDIAGRLPEEQKPEAVLSCQRFIHTLNGKGEYCSCNQWNDRQMALHRQLWQDISRNFPNWKQIIEKRFTIVEQAVNDLGFAFMVPAAEAPDLKALVKELIAPWPDAQLSGNHEWTFVLHRAFSKGRLLAEYARRRGVLRQSIVAVGDGYNDISMLNGSVTDHLGCPADASPEVRQVVQESGGLVADRPGPAGTLQVVQRFARLVLGDHLPVGG